ncbi:MAG: TIGR03790 family protein [Verrucomicrobia bacterium]|nr:TIGR03790 family protein [Verrucomicrobiota bacterium]
MPLHAMAQEEDLASKVVVVANGSMPSSRKVAEEYMALRSIPEDNLILLQTAPGAQVSREEFRNTIRNPLLRKLREGGFVDGMEGDPDDFGRDTITLFRRNVRYLVLCFGVPYRIQKLPAPGAEDVELREKAFSRRSPHLTKAFAEGKLARDNASVDTELALLLHRDVPLTGFVPNPLFKRKEEPAGHDVLRVTRLDGPSPEAVLKMVRNGIEGERRGLRGRAYIDEDRRGGNFQAGDDWLIASAEIFRQLGFDLTQEKSGDTLPVDARFDAPVLYGGWYTARVNGPFRLPGFEFPPGAIAAHLHSGSARSLRSPRGGWVGPLVDRGVSATFGNVHEPFLRFTHHFHLLFAALANGWNFGDAASFAYPSLSWQGVAVGDPLFRPFARRLEEQLEDVDNPAESLQNQYVLLRRINLLEADGRLEEALRLATRGMRTSPGPALGLKRARLLLKAEEPRKARHALSFLSRLEPEESTEWGLMAEIADALLGLDDPESALAIYRKILRRIDPGEIHKAFLRRAIPVAEKAGERDLALEWEAILHPPPPPPEPTSGPQPENEDS